MLHIAGTEAAVPLVLTAGLFQTCLGTSLSCCRQWLWWIVLYLFYSCFNTDFFHSPQMAPESTVCVPKEIPGSFFPPHLLPGGKKYTYFLCVMAFCGTPPTTSPFFPLPWIIFSQGGEGMGWDGMGKKELLSCFLAMILSTTISFLTSYSLFIKSPCTLTIVLLPQLHWLYFPNFSHFGAWNQCGLFSYMVTWNSL